MWLFLVKSGPGRTVACEPLQPRAPGDTNLRLDVICIRIVSLVSTRFACPVRTYRAICHTCVIRVLFDVCRVLQSVTSRNVATVQKTIWAARRRSMQRVARGSRCPEERGYPRLRPPVSGSSSIDIARTRCIDPLCKRRTGSKQVLAASPAARMSCNAFPFEVRLPEWLRGSGRPRC